MTWQEVRDKAHWSSSTLWDVENSLGYKADAEEAPEKISKLSVDVFRAVEELWNAIEKKDDEEEE